MSNMKLYVDESTREVAIVDFGIAKSVTDFFDNVMSFISEEVGNVSDSYEKESEALDVAIEFFNGLEEEVQDDMLRLMNLGPIYSVIEDLAA